jgi:hypothetical protein
MDDLAHLIEQTNPMQRSSKYMASSFARALSTHPLGRRLKILSKLVNHELHSGDPCFKCQILKEYRDIRKNLS